MNFEQGHFYHVYNRGNNSKAIFFNSDNYVFFLKKIRHHLSPLVRIIAYCLMPNHFHLLIYVPYEVDSSGDSKSSDELAWSKDITTAVAIILRSYTRAINKQK